MVNSSDFLYQPPTGNVTSVTDVFRWINGGVDNWFFPGILVSVWLIIIIKMQFNPSNEISKSFASTSFIVMILAVFCRVLNFISTGFLSIFIVLTGFGMAWMYLDGAR